MININDCRIEWFAALDRKSLIRVTHLPTGRYVERPCKLREDWKLDDALDEINAAISRNDN